jgi:hypothetical protein
MESRILRAVVAASLILPASVAHSADFTFTFGSDLSDPLVTNAMPGTVTGRIIGLADTGTSSASQIFIDSFSPDLTLGYPLDATSWFSQWENSFTVADGLIVSAIFYADNDFANPSLDRLYINVPIQETGGTNYVSVGSNNAISIWNNQGLSGITFSRIGSAVPDPSTWVLMIFGFGAVGSCLRLKRKKSVLLLERA